MKIPKFKVQMKVILMITTTIISVFLIRLLLMGGLAKLLSFDSQRTKVYIKIQISRITSGTLERMLRKNMLINGEWMKAFFQKVLQIT